MTDVTCHGRKDGLIEVRVCGGYTNNQSKYYFSLDGINYQNNSFLTRMRAFKGKVYIHDARGCKLDTFLTLVEPPVFNPKFYPEDTTIFAGNSVKYRFSLDTFFKEKNISYAWEANEGLYCPDCKEQDATPYNTRFYHVTKKYNNDCEEIRTVIVRTEDSLNVFVPNAFSPDGKNDRENERFKVYATNVKKLTGKVLDRWGEVMYEGELMSREPYDNVGWDGKYKGGGTCLRVSIYMVEVELLSGKKHVLSGSVTLLR